MCGYPPVSRLQHLDVELAVAKLCASLNLDPASVAAAIGRAAPHELDDVRDSHVALRRGPLALAGDVYNAGTEFRVRVRSCACVRVCV